MLALDQTAVAKSVVKERVHLFLTTKMGSKSNFTVVDVAAAVVVLMLVQRAV